MEIIVSPIPYSPLSYQRRSPPDPGKKLRVMIHDTINKLPHNFMYSLSKSIRSFNTTRSLGNTLLAQISTGNKTLKIGGRKRDDKEGKNEKKVNKNEKIPS